jgi:CRISPR system Cascade subunit CasE
MSPRLCLVSLPIERPRLISFAMGRGTISRSGDLGYSIHQALTETFGSAAPKPFHFFGDPTCQLIAYTPFDTEELNGFAFAQRTHIPNWELASQVINLKEMQSASMPAWTSGRRYRFTVRARPVCRISHARERKLPRECDVFLRAVASKSAHGDAWLNREAVYLSWFREQFPESVAKLLAVRISRMTRMQVYRKGSPSVEGPDVTFAGALEIRDPGAFGGCVARGIGRHRAFGFGMLTLASV